MAMEMTTLGNAIIDKDASVVCCAPKIEVEQSATPRCGIVLAGGDGKRLEPFIDRLRGGSLPKQYMNFTGNRSMLEHTFRRAEKLISSDLLFTVVNQHHLGFPVVRRQLSNRPQGSVVVQPKNKETGPGLLLPLIHLYKHYPEATVAVFPADHFIAEENLFMLHVGLAFRIVERNPSRLVLLGMAPSEAESDYGYILPGQPVESLLPSGTRGISQFIEKPKRAAAQELIANGGLWNTLVMVFKAETLLNLVGDCDPTLFSVFGRISEAIGTVAETDVVEEVYRQMEPVNFSRCFLEPLSRQDPSPLWVLPVRGVHWSDWGSERRIMRTLRKSGHPRGDGCTKLYITGHKDPTL